MMLDVKGGGVPLHTIYPFKKNLVYCFITEVKLSNLYNNYFARPSAVIFENFEAVAIFLQTNWKSTL